MMSDECRVVTGNNVFSGGASLGGSGGCEFWGRKNRAQTMSFSCPFRALFVPFSCPKRALIGWLGGSEWRMGVGGRAGAQGEGGRRGAGKRRRSWVPSCLVQRPPGEGRGLRVYGCVGSRCAPRRRVRP